MFQLGLDPTNKNAVGIGECLGCDNCTGMCREVFEVVFLPEILLERDIPAG